MNPSLRTVKIILLSILAPICYGCAPIPHYAIISPEITGTIHRNGTPVKNAVVYVEHPMDEHCSFTGDVLARTNSDGQFHVAVRKEFRFIMAMDPWQNWQVCIADGDDRYQGWYHNGLGGPPPAVDLDCNLESEPQVKQIGKSMGKTRGVCRVGSDYY